MIIIIHVQNIQENKKQPDEIVQTIVFSGWYFIFVPPQGWRTKNVKPECQKETQIWSDGLKASSKTGRYFNPGVVLRKWISKYDQNLSDINSRSSKNWTTNFQIPKFRIIVRATRGQVNLCNKHNNDGASFGIILNFRFREKLWLVWNLFWNDAYFLERVKVCRKSQ